ncbi:hypothetical protein KZZ52_00235 [Dactylosporangium sp. AC04546]|uniref:hypothetical protein n=1 Tax=Dactylosporangium sp. AC04546 TaxID=2862460 RepID=UPI001EE0CAE9|nr:hypothetical protein [Dactylosporangium sp. AC04546]WVK83924.1 hypothetical protein KZZ52_00235 [Dactylosporangium sp. AC04546]
MSDLVFAFVSGGGLLALSIGAFGVLDAYNKRGVGEKRVDWLIGLYALGVVMNIVAYVMLDRWYIAAPLALMLLPAERALEKRGTFKRRGAKVNAITGRD